MKGKKYAMMGALIFASMILAAMPSFALTADDFNFSGTDPAGDVSDPNADLISAYASAEGDNVIFSLTVAGTIVANNSSYGYGFTVQSSNGAQMMITYTDGEAYYVMSMSYSVATYMISGSSLKIIVPMSAFSSFDDITVVTASVIADNAGDQIAMWGSGSGGGSGGGYEEEKCPDPTKETPTDTSISVDITQVKITFEKVDNGTKMHMSMMIKGTTSGVDHVSLNVVWYYKNGTHDWSWSWLRGPMSPPPFTPPGMVINEMSFQSTSGEWNTWELNIDITEPITYAERNYSSAEHISDVSKVRIYARAFADPEETQWNQAYYEFTPQITSNGESMTYDSTQESSSSSGGIPGFEALAAVGALSIAAIIYSRKRR